MMASINPLGERARGNRWWRTAWAFSAGCVLGGWALGAAAGAIGTVLAALAPPPTNVLLLIATALVLSAGMAELGDWPVPSVRRQVDELWIGRYRGWVYGAGFGVQLGAGLATTVTSAAVYATVGLASVLGAAGEPAWAQATGGVFGLARAVPVLGGWALHDAASLRRRVARAAAAATGCRLASGCCLCGLAAWTAAAL